MTKRRDHNQDLEVPRRPIRLGRWAVFPPAGFCIYCGRTDVDLTDEHVVPAALGGDVVLPLASCDDCQKIINQQIEQPINDLNSGTFGPLRLSLGIRPRRGTIKKDGVELSIMNENGNRREIRVGRGEIPPILVGMVTGRRTPGVLAGREPTDEVGGELWISYHEEKLNRMIVPGEALFGLINFNPIMIFRLIAKIAHGVAYATYGDIFEPCLSDLILGKSNIIEHFIGSYLLPNGDNKGVHSTRAGLAGEEYEYVIVRIRLFCGFSAPSYTVVVGKRRGSLQDFGFRQDENGDLQVK